MYSIEMGLANVSIEIKRTF